VVHSISRPAKPSVIGDDVGINGLEYNNNMEENNAEHNDKLHVGDTDRKDIEMSEVRTGLFQPQNWA
jgi:hypothetical protein